MKYFFVSVLFAIGFSQEAVFDVYEGNEFISNEFTHASEFPGGWFINGMGMYNVDNQTLEPLPLFEGYHSPFIHQGWVYFISNSGEICRYNISLGVVQNLGFQSEQLRKVLYRDKLFFKVNSRMIEFDPITLETTDLGYTYWDYALIYNDDFYFFSSSLFKYDGNAVENIFTYNSPRGSPAPVVASNGFYFNSQMGLIFSDGTPSGTRVIFNESVENMVLFHDQLFFIEGNRKVVWRSDGSVAGTELFFEALPGNVSSQSDSLFASDAQLFFKAIHPFLGRSQYVSDGTLGGTHLYDGPPLGQFLTAFKGELITILDNKLFVLRENLELIFDFENPHSIGTRVGQNEILFIIGNDLLWFDGLTTKTLPISYSKPRSGPYYTSSFGQNSLLWHGSTFVQIGPDFLSTPFPPWEAPETISEVNGNLYFVDQGLKKYNHDLDQIEHVLDGNYAAVWQFHDQIFLVRDMQAPLLFDPDLEIITELFHPQQYFPQVPSSTRMNGKLEEFYFQDWKINNDFPFFHRIENGGMVVRAQTDSKVILRPYYDETFTIYDPQIGGPIGNFEGQPNHYFPAGQSLLNDRLYFSNSNGRFFLDLNTLEVQSAQSVLNENHFESLLLGPNHSIFYKNQRWWSSTQVGPPKAFNHNIPRYGAISYDRDIGLYFFTLNDHFGDEFWVTDGDPEHIGRLADINPGPPSSFATNPVFWQGDLYFVAGHSQIGNAIFRIDGSSISFKEPALGSILVAEYDANNDTHLSKIEAVLVRDLSLSNLEIRNTFDFGHFSNLESLDISGNELADISVFLNILQFGSQTDHLLNVENNQLNESSCDVISQIQEKFSLTGATFLFENQGGHHMRPPWSSWPNRDMTIFIAGEFVPAYTLTCP